MRLIDADALKRRAITVRFFGKDIMMVPTAEIDDAPTIDAVEVVRCGGCKHMTAEGRCLEFADDKIRPSATDFCSYGERREGGEV